ncbi:KilA-N domain-containing protein [Dyadobacter sp. 3J3]|uniref:KilA-N domain-containing protein n=1 Tax=Dyadobacter sp. 3J3 TaxID=2606600 RepID=UPI00135AE57B
MIQIFEYENSPIQFEVINGQVMAKVTAMFKANNPRLDTWKNSDSTNRYINACYLKWGTSKFQLIIIRMVSAENGGGTWIHEKLILNAARYISTVFEL